MADRGSAVLTPFRRLSVVIPVLDEAENIAALVPQIHAVMASVRDVTDYEIIVVDDGSTDATASALASMRASDPRLTVVTLRTNFGKSAALMAGFDRAAGDVVITMDGDLQDDPKEIPHFLAEMRKGYDLVSGWKRHRQDPMEKRLASRVFNATTSLLTGLRLNDFNCGFKAYRRWCLQDLRLTGNLYRFLPIFVHQKGGRISEIPVEHHRRAHGQSKFGMSRYFHGAADFCTILLLSKFFQRPLYFFAPIGASLAALGTILGMWLVGGHIYWLMSGDKSYQLNTRPLLQIAVTLFGVGLEIVLIGLLAELIVSRTVAGKIYSVKDE